MGWRKHLLVTPLHLGVNTHGFPVSFPSFKSIESMNPYEKKRLTRIYVLRVPQVSIIPNFFCTRDPLPRSFRWLPGPWRALGGTMPKPCCGSCKPWARRDGPSWAIWGISNGKKQHAESSYGEALQLTIPRVSTINIHKSHKSHKSLRLTKWLLPWLQILSESCGVPGGSWGFHHPGGPVPPQRAERPAAGHLQLGLCQSRADPGAKWMAWDWAPQKKRWTWLTYDGFYGFIMVYCFFFWCGGLMVKSWFYELYTCLVLLKRTVWSLMDGTMVVVEDFPPLKWLVFAGSRVDPERHRAGSRAKGHQRRKNEDR